MVVPGDDQVVEQLTKQLYKLINVLKVQELTEVPCVERELMLLKVNANSQSRSEIIEFAQIFRARVVDVAEDSLTLEVVGRPRQNGGHCSGLEPLRHSRNCPYG